MQDIINELKNKASVIRQYIIQMLGNLVQDIRRLSVVLIFLSVCISGKYRWIPQSHWEKQDRFVLMRHAAPALYAVLAEKGFSC